MNKSLAIGVVVLLSACNGRLTEEQKNKIKEEMESSQIKKFTDAQITEAAFAYGRQIAQQLETREGALQNRRLIDSLQRVFRVQIEPLRPTDSLLKEMEKKIIEAYIAGTGQANLTDNVQKIGADTILYTKPFMKTKSDGSSELQNVVGVRMAKREVIKSIDK